MGLAPHVGRQKAHDIVYGVVVGFAIDTDTKSVDVLNRNGRGDGGFGCQPPELKSCVIRSTTLGASQTMVLQDVRWIELKSPA